MTDTGEPQAGMPNDVKPIAKIATGIRGLDEILRGGLPRGRTTMVSGGPGTGKTVLAAEFLYRGAIAGEAGVLVTFEERADDLKSNAAAMGWDLEELERQGKLRIVSAEVPHHALRAGEFNIQGLIALIDGHLQAVGAKRLALDALDVLMRIFGNPERERGELYALLDWLRGRGLTTLITVKTQTSGEQVYPFLDFMTDCVLCLDQRMAGQVRTRRLTVSKYRGSGFLNNEYPYVISSAGMVFMPISTLALTNGHVSRRVSSGLPALDDLLGGGFQRSTAILLAGPSGVGKTLVASTFAGSASSRRERVLYTSFEESESSLIDGMRSAGIDLRDAVRTGQLRIISALPESSGVEQHLMRIIDECETLKPDHLIVDAISACQRMGSEQAAFDFLVRLLTYAKQHDTTCIYTNQTVRQDQIVEISGIGISSLVDTCLSLQFLDDGRQLSRRLMIIKSRGSRHSMDYHEFRITDQGIELNGASARSGTA